MNRLLDLKALAIDCQATGANPERGWLLEIGWAPTSARLEHSSSARGALIQPPEGGEVPPRVSRVTGISNQDLLEGRPLPSVRRSLAGAARRVARANQMSRCPAVIHFARFEEPFLRDLFGRRFPFDLLCTHEIARRLLPDLPRRGLRAVAGYFGHSVPELRRAAPHVEATAFIWKSLVEALDSMGVDTLEELRKWLACTEGAVRCGRDFPMKPEVRKSLPNTPGVYRMQRANGDVLYVGKASRLRNRVNSYFHRGSGRAERTLEMLAQARRLEVSPTETSLEAALLESDEIKRISPPYNVALRRRGRSPLFASPDFERFSDQPSPDFPWGPFAARRMAAPLSLILNLTAAAPSRRGEILESGDFRGVDESDRFDAARRIEGVELFLTRHGLTGGLTVPRLLQLCARLELLVRTAKEAEEAETPDRPSEDRPQQPEPPTPETTAAWLEKGLTRAGKAVRRARWLCRLSESSIVWRPARRSSRRLLVVRSGEAEASWIQDGQSPPPLRSRSLLERQRGLDWTRCDRLRTLTAELRRLAAAGRLIEVWLGRRPLRGRGLLQALQRL